MKNVTRMSRQRTRALLRWAKRLGDVGTYVRAQIVALAGRGRSASEIVETVGCVPAHVYRTLKRFAASGREGLLDGRRNNGSCKATDEYASTVESLLYRTPRDHGYLRPTWTRELLVLVAEELTGITVSLATMSRVLRRLGARRGRPKPVVRCTLSDRQRRRRLQAIRELLAGLPADEVAVYEDEVDIHLNPKLGLDWMPRGRQKQVITPGQNEKVYLAGTLDARDGTVLRVGGLDKNSSLFIQMLEALDEHYLDAKSIHVILDNYSIHDSHQTRAALERLPRIDLHFLPPYCPDHNRIERLWEDLHANVTRNHQHDSFDGLCPEVARWFEVNTPWKAGGCPALTTFA